METGAFMAFFDALIESLDGANAVTNAQQTIAYIQSLANMIEFYERNISQ
jgi:hypothetical protein